MPDERAEEWNRRLDAVVERFTALATSGPRSGLTDPDPGGEERWAYANVWAHVAEFGPYWTAELRKILASGADGPVPFGRTKADSERRAAIAAADEADVANYLESALAAMKELSELLDQMRDEDWSRVGAHPTLGEMTVPRILQEFLVGHYEEHADQLELLDE